MLHPCVFLMFPDVIQNYTNLDMNSATTATIMIPNGTTTSPPGQGDTFTRTTISVFSDEHHWKPHVPFPHKRYTEQIHSVPSSAFRRRKYARKYCMKALFICSAEAILYHHYFVVVSVLRICHMEKILCDVG